jgi:hypothetical protein
MFDVRLRIRCLLRQGVYEFERSTLLPFVPRPGISLHEGPDPASGTSRYIGDVIWLAVGFNGEGRFLCQLEDDLDAAQDFGDDASALTEHYEAQGWRPAGSGPLRLLGLDRLAPAPA